MMQKEIFGSLEDGSVVEKFVLSNKNGFSVHVLSYGLYIQKILFPDGKDIVLGYDDLNAYVHDEYYLGCIVGRNANRLSNGEIHIDNNAIQLSQNEPPKQLHGGFQGFNKKNWDCEIIALGEREVLRCSYLSKDGEEGYPGNLQTVITFELKNDNSLVMNYESVTDKPTVVNLTRHDYFNLVDEGKTGIKNHVLQINGGFYTPTDDLNLPTGEILTVENTVLDFQKEAHIQQKLNEFEGALPMGYDHNYVINKAKDELNVAAVLKNRVDSKQLAIYTTQPGVQFYSAAYVQNLKGKDEVVYGAYSGLCLETQHFADATAYKHFETTILKPKNKYTHQLIYKFTP